MAVSGETLRLLDGLRLVLDASVDQATQDLTRAWATAWNEVAGEWEAALVQLQRSATDGVWPSQRTVRRALVALTALDHTREGLAGLGRYAGVRILQDVPAVSADTVTWLNQVLGSQYPSPALAASFTRVDQSALDAIVKRTTQRVTSTVAPLSGQAERAMKSALIRGVAFGANPNKVAADMLARVQGAFDGGLIRAKVIARTEILDAHRAAAREQHMANADVLTGWEWLAQLDQRTCPACWSQHGSVHDVEDPGPSGHQQCRCTRLPVVKPWTQLGFVGLSEPPSLMPDAQATFARLSSNTQVQIMGRERLALLKSGAVKWSDLATLRHTAGWRDSWAPTPVRDLRAMAARAAA